MEYALTEIINYVDELCTELSEIIKDYVTNMEQTLRTGTSKNNSIF